MLAQVTLAQAAELSLRMVTSSPSDVEWLTWVWLIIFSIGGWGASSFAKLAGWFGGTVRERFALVQNIWVSIVAGVLAFFGGQVGGLSEMACMVSAGFAAFAGDKWLSSKIGTGGDPTGLNNQQPPPQPPPLPPEQNPRGTGNP